jgi:hypothetical protein
MIIIQTYNNMPTRIVEDGNNIPVNELLSGNTQDINGSKLDFHQVGSSNDYIAEISMNDGTNRTVRYSFSIPGATATVTRKVQ